MLAAGHRLGATALGTPRLAFLIPCALFAGLFLWVSVQANRDIAQSVAIQVAKLNSEFCEQLVGPPNTHRYASCMEELARLIKKDRDFEASSDLF